MTDPSGALVPNATVTVSDVSKGTSQTVQSNAGGEYSVSRLIPDTYTVKATARDSLLLRLTTLLFPPAARLKSILPFSPLGLRSRDRNHCDSPSPSG